MALDHTTSKIVLCILLVGGIVLAVSILFAVRKSKRDKPEQNKNQVINNTEESFESDCITDKMRASVIDQFCRVEMVGTRSPKSVEIFTIVFENDYGKVIKLDVPKEMYDGIDKGQRGILTIMNGELYSFELQ